MARLLSVNVGLPRDVTWQGRTVHTAIWKAPVEGPRMVRRLNVEGDGQRDLTGHGGERRAVFVYQMDSYRYWQDQLGRNDFAYGQFGENFTVDGLPDTEVCIGDRYRIGSALFEVTQPRVTCYRLGIRMNEPEMAALVVKHTLRPGDTPVVLLSAGIGVTPVLAMLHASAAEASTREIWWLYGTRNGREHPFAEETRGLLEALANRHSHICYSSPDPEDRPKLDFDAPGRLNMRVLRELNLPRNGDFYICGPSTFMSDLTAGLTGLGVAADRIHTEMFGAGPSMTPGIAASPRRPPHLPAGHPGSGALVSFARTGLNVRWEPTFQSLLELAEACDLPVRWSCRTGVCHTCETGLVAGKISYRPDPVDAPANGNVLICCSRPEGDVVIDL
jgi:MOSC domain-containing protein YiiM/ferredoxin